MEASSFPVAAAIYPYQRTCLREEVEKIDKTSALLDKKLNDIIHVFVKDHTVVNHNTERTSFTLRIKPTTPVGEIRDKIEAKYDEFGYHDVKSEGHLRLVFAGQTLVDGKRFCDYACRKTWSKPFAGVIWIVPFHIARASAMEWGACSDLESREAELPPEWKI